MLIFAIFDVSLNNKILHNLSIRKSRRLLSLLVPNGSHFLLFDLFFELLSKYFSPVFGVGQMSFNLVLDRKSTIKELQYLAF